jgi:hypothetical protein
LQSTHLLKQVQQRSLCFDIFHALGLLPEEPPLPGLDLDEQLKNTRREALILCRHRRDGRSQSGVLMAELVDGIHRPEVSTIDVVELCQLVTILWC